MSAKSYWQECRVDGNQEAIKSWFVGMAEDMHVTKAEILCDVETDMERKIRIFARKGERDYVLTRTKGRRFTVSCKEVAK